MSAYIRGSPPKNVFEQVTEPESVFCIHVVPVPYLTWVFAGTVKVWSSVAAFFQVMVVGGVVINAKFAVTCLFVSIVMLHTFVVLVHAPVQPVKVEPGFGVAVRVTVAPGAYGLAFNSEIDPDPFPKV